ncbi:hypothetical protein [Pseudoalteromonas ruthenica]|uniref:hypothetical protein n=1 Tax=Pseudoalteromonas ruthenica TaxID=151081 RepID=UPI00110A3967|nr:hypothetical protein [Pseudoalteromonas ruthenica]TMO97547.1 hypothetical protein CWC07_13785 [Pseudoalteromonas ruthenica]
MALAIKGITAARLVAAMERAGHTLFTGELNLNLIGVRNKDTDANTFNDVFCVLYQKGDKWQLKQFACTTDPGVFYRENPINVDGTAVPVPMQHRSLWTFGNHKGYAALVQNKPVTVYRDSDKDAAINTDVALDSVTTQTGWFGINCHRASKHTTSKLVDKWSAGCQVFANPNDFEQLLTLCTQSAKVYGNTFTYTLLNQADLTKK